MGFHQPITKYSPPRIPAEYVLRSPLSAKIERIFKSKNIYLYAPSGYSKRLTVARWLKGRKRKVAWLALDQYDNNSLAFYKEFLQAMIADTTDRRERSALLRDPGLTQYPLAYLLKVLPSYVAENKISGMVLEGMHHVDNKEILSALPLIQKALPESFRFIFLSSEKPPVEFAVWKKKLYVIDQEELVFTVDDINSLIKKYDKKAEPQLAEKIYEASDGWPLAASIIFHSYRDGKNEIRQIKNKKDLYAYYGEKLNSLVTPREKDFLLRISMGGNLSLGFCKALAGNLDYTSLMNRISLEIGLVYKLDRGWKLLRLFQEYLLEEFRKRDQSFIDWASERAFNYYRNKKQPFAAAALAIELKDFNLLTKLLNETSKSGKEITSIEEDTHSVSAFIVERLSTDDILKIEGLFFEAAWIDYLTGNLRGMKKWMKIIEQIFNISDLEHSDAFLTRKLLGLSLPGAGIEAFLNLLDEAEASPMVEPGSYISRITFTLNLPFFHKSFQDFSEAFKVVSEEEAYERLGKMKSHLYRAASDMIQGGLALEKFDLEKALKHALDAYPPEFESNIPELMFSTTVLLCEIYYAKDMPDEAKRLMKHLKSALTKNDGLFLHDNIYAYEARRRLYAGDTKVAKEWLNRVVYLRGNAKLFYRTYQNLTTARMLIQTNQVDEAIAFLKDIEDLCEGYGRKLDTIESNILISKCYWYKRDEKTALKHMEKAILLSQDQRITYPFLIEGADISPIIVRMLYNTEKKFPKCDKEFLSYLKRRTTPMRAITEGVELKNYLKNLKLSKKQKEMLNYLAEGKTYAEITEVSGLSFGTVKVHIRTLYNRLMVRSAGEALARCKELGIEY